MPDFAANVAEELIKIGVRCVVAAGWAVDDEPAMLFARRFYQELDRGRPFAEAVGKAREEVWRRHPESNTWAAYQCYGDPDWMFRDDRRSEAAPRRLPEVPSAAALIGRLEALVAAHAYQDRSAEQVRAQVEQLDAACAGVWGGSGAVAAAFGAVYAEIGEFERAVDWYNRALASEDGSATLRAMEQLGNVRARRAAKLANAPAARREARAGIELLERAAAIAPTVERLSLLGSACKRLALVEKGAGAGTAERAALQASLRNYRAAEDLARKTNADNLFYPAMNRMSVELVFQAATAAGRAFDPADVSAVRQSLQKRNDDDPDFWSVIGLTELRIYEALAARSLARSLAGILEDLGDLMSRSSSTRMWASAADQARFVLAPYIASRRASAAEREAARRLLEKLEGESQRARSGPSTARTSGSRARARPGRRSPQARARRG
jgi:tetratricopeptide (TPR) repeat protein